MFPLQPHLFVDAVFRFQIVVAHQITGTGARGAALAVTVKQIVRVGLIQARRFVGAGDAHFQREVIA